MAITNTIKTNWPMRIAMLWVAVTVVALIISQRLFGTIPVFDFRFNGYALMSLTGAVANIVFFMYLWRSSLKNEEITWYMIFLGSLIIFSAGELLQRLSANPQGAVFWAQFSTIGLALEPALILMFILTLTNPTKRHSLVLTLLLFGSTILTFFHVNGPLIFHNEVAHTFLEPWGYTNDVGRAYIINLVWFIVLGFISVYLIAKFRHQATNPVLRKQATIFLIAITLPLLGGFLTDGGGPALGFNVPPAHSFLSTIMAGLLLYGMIRYKLFQVTPASISQEILSTMSEGVLVLNENFEIELMNTAAEKMFSKKFTALSHLSVMTLFSDKEADVLQRGIHNAKQSNKTYVVDELELVHGEQTKYLRVTVTITMSSGGLKGYVLAISDITALKLSYLELQAEKASVDRKVRERTQQLANTQARLLASIGSLQQGFIMTDKEFRVLTTNDAARAILGISYKKLLDLEDLDMPVAEHKRLPEQIKQSFKHKIPMVFPEATHRDRILTVFISPIIQENEIIGNVILLSDVTEERIMQRSKDEFFSIASHELRTPLTAIRGNIGMMLEYYKPIIEKEPDFKQILSDVYSSSKNLIEIVSDFLDVSRIEQGKVSYQNTAFPIEKLIENVMYEMKGVIREKKLYLKSNTKTLDSLPQVYADQERTKQVLYNLIGNASKFTENGGITISVKLKGTKELAIEIADTGRGISPENQKLLFHKFQQASDSLLTRDTMRGTGLGLYISKILTENMGGSVHLDSSEVGKGSVFSFTLPIATTDQIASSVDSSAAVKVDSKTGLTLRA